MVHINSIPNYNMHPVTNRTHVRSNLNLCIGHNVYLWVLRALALLIEGFPTSCPSLQSSINR